MAMSSFWLSLGAPKTVLAPMVEQSELAFRLLCKEYGAELTYTPMLHARLTHEQVSYRERYLDFHPSDQPIIAQFCGHDANTILKASEYVLSSVSAIDLNLGCPQGIAKRGFYGAFLLECPQLVENIVSTLVQSLPIPITCKVRKVSQDLQETIRFCESLQQKGCSAICLHGRTRFEIGRQIGECDWETIRILKQRLTIPVIANGGIEYASDIQKCLNYTGADAVMVAEAALENPSIFRLDSIYDDSLLLCDKYLKLAERFTPSAGTIRAHLMRFIYNDCQILKKSGPQAMNQIAQAQTLEEFKKAIEYLKHLRQTEEYISHMKQNRYLRWYCRHRRCNDRQKIRNSESLGYDLMDTDSLALLL